MWGNEGRGEESSSGSGQWTLGINSSAASGFPGVRKKYIDGKSSLPNFFSSHEVFFASVHTINHQPSTSLNTAQTAIQTVPKLVFVTQTLNILDTYSNPQLFLNDTEKQIII
ncbi:hypothetical protein E2C01_055736 [Portunus trituberculatus]|uniref:Uncharacterized protein n=1 Tax=Portunus trituberculatus TaxID=210409 RepID=A0A5B7GNI3_PORTR|nr:hypothetical protein [Portunus trituberculatus]